MIATDPLSLVFLGCFVFAAAFLLLSTAAGAGHGHGLHLGHAGAAGHAGHIGHTGHVGHAGTSGNGSSGGATGGASGASFWSSLLGQLEGALSVYGILTFLLIFGLLGYLLHNATNAGAVLTVAIALFVGGACAVAVSALLTRMFLASESHGLTSDSSRLEGRLGQVTMPIREGGTGEVLFTSEAGSRHSLGARSLDGAPIPAGTEVVIVSSRDGIATVQPWDRFMASVRAGEAPRLEPIDRSS